MASFKWYNCSLSGTEVLRRGSSSTRLYCQQQLLLRAQKLDSISQKPLIQQIVPYLSLRNSSGYLFDGGSAPLHGQSSASFDQVLWTLCFIPNLNSSMRILGDQCCRYRRLGIPLLLEIAIKHIRKTKATSQIDSYSDLRKFTVIGSCGMQRYDAYFRLHVPVDINMSLSS